jgi:hypothetical protein
MIKVVATLLLLTMAPIGAERRPPETGKWRVFAGHEEQALRDYEWRRTSSDVIENGRKLRDLARQPQFGSRHEPCGQAASTLSHMVTGQYYSARRLAVSADWHQMAPSYAIQRRACLDDLGIDERAHPLPRWFGR